MSRTGELLSVAASLATVAGVTYAIGYNVGQGTLEQSSQRVTELRSENDELRSQVSELTDSMSSPVPRAPSPSAAETPSGQGGGAAEGGASDSTALEPSPGTAGTVLWQRPLDLVLGPNYWDLDEWAPAITRGGPTDVSVAYDGSRTNLQIPAGVGSAVVADPTRESCLSATNRTRNLVLEEGQAICIYTSDDNIALLIIQQLPDRNRGEDTVRFDATVWLEQ